MQRPKSAENKQKYSLEEMFQNRSNSEFGIKGYNHPKSYVDPEKIIKERFYKTQKKGQKTTKHVTKRGSYLDVIFEIDRKKYPKSVHYNVTNDMPLAKPKNPVKKYETKRDTFIDIIRKPKNVKAVPGVGKYNIILTEAQQKEQTKIIRAKKIKQGEKDNFLCDFQRLGIERPGSGQYNPHYEVKKIKEQMTWDNTKDWMQKHKEQAKKVKKSKFPDMGTYDPQPVEFKTFGLQLKEKKQRPSSAKPGKMFGTQERFPIKKGVKKTPAPGTYDLITYWKGKPFGKKDDNKKNWQQNITKGTYETRSIYY